MSDINTKRIEDKIDLMVSEIQAIKRMLENVLLNTPMKVKEKAPRKIRRTENQLIEEMANRQIEKYLKKVNNRF